VTDDELAAAFAAHAPEAFAEAYRRHGDALARAARHVLDRSDDVRDVVHDALMRVWSSASYRRERGELRAFLIVCVRNEAIARVRSAQRRSERERRAAAAVVPLPAVDDAERVAVRAALATLPADQREVLALAYWGDLTQTEIAARLQIPLGTVKSRVALGVRALARRFAPGDRR
jgi:RNA polymerase sigma-70 factor (ECF subfamily)